MRRVLVCLALTLVSMTVLAQPRSVRRVQPSPGARSAEGAVKEAVERLGHLKKRLDLDLKVLALIRAADRALTDPMQPSVAVEEAYEQIAEAERTNDDFYVRQGLVRSRQELEAARRSPGSADFARLRALIRSHALGPSSRLVVRNATDLQQETLEWIAVQEMIATHLKTLAEITGESLRASADEER